MVFWKLNELYENHTWKNAQLYFLPSEIKVSTSVTRNALNTKRIHRKENKITSV